MLTLDPVTKGETGVGGTESVTQHLLLEIDDWLKHSLILDLSGRDHNAAVHEVSDGVGQIFVGLGQEGLQTEHLCEEKHRKLLVTKQSTVIFIGVDCVISLLKLHAAELLFPSLPTFSSLSPSRPSEHPWRGHFHCSLLLPGWGPPAQRRSEQGQDTPGQTASPQSHSTLQKPPLVSAGGPGHLSKTPFFSHICSRITYKNRETHNCI